MRMLLGHESCRPFMTLQEWTDHVFDRVHLATEIADTSAGQPGRQGH